MTSRVWQRLTTAAGPILGLLVVLGLFALNSEVRPSVFTGGNFKLILVQTVIVAIGALGMTLIIITGGIDLSVGSLVAVATVVGAKSLEAGFSPPLASLFVILAGALIGSINGAMIAGVRLLPFIVTLGTMGILRGAGKWLAGNQVVHAPGASELMFLMERRNPTQFLPLPPGVWIALGLAVLTSLLLQRTVFGRHIFAIGSNEATARLCGVRVQWTKLLTYTVAGLFFGLAGLLQMTRLGEGDPTGAIGLELDIIAAVVIGGASLNGGVGSIWGSVLGALVMAVLRNGLGQMDLGNYLQEIIIGTVIILAVGLDKWRQSRMKSAR
ncbi:MAG: ABC transporter permease [Verrucomicrobiales bacterium]|nr:ABC transporter permease [Verrucomicrobiales bacterium]